MVKLGVSGSYTPRGELRRGARLRGGLLEGAEDHAPGGEAPPVPLHLDGGQRERAEVRGDGVDQYNYDGHVRVARDGALRLETRRVARG